MDYLRNENNLIINELLSSKKVMAGQLIRYEDFLTIYEPYKERITEKEFAEMLGIADSNFISIKYHKSKKAKILKNQKTKISEEEKEQIMDELISSKKVKAGQLISYEDFLIIYEQYKERMTELELAELLDISWRNLRQIKYCSTRTQVLKNQKIKMSEEEKEQTRNELLENKTIKAGQSISYDDFIIIYEPYKEKMTELEFAQIIGIAYSSFYNMRYNKGKKAKVLKKQKQNISVEGKEQIRNELLTNNTIKAGQSISYDDFIIIYETYKERIAEKEFAEILGIDYHGWGHIKYQGKRTKVLKDQKTKISEEEKEQIRNELLENKKIRERQLISYDDFIKIYELYKEKMTELEFASILGISYINLRNIKHKPTRTKVRKSDEYKKTIRIRHIFKEARYYEKEEIEEISKKYDIDIDTVLNSLLSIKKDETLLNIKDVLNKKGRIFLGRIKFSEEFGNNYAKKMLDISRKISISLCKKYRCMNIVDDVASNAIMFVLEKCGYIEKNFIDDEEMINKMIKSNIYTYIKYKCFENATTKKPISLEGTFEYKGEERDQNFLDRGVKDETENTEAKIEEKIMKETEGKKGRPEERCIELLKAYLEKGASKKEALSKTAKSLGVKPEEMLKLMQEYLIKHKKVKKTENGEYILGE